MDTTPRKSKDTTGIQSLETGLSIAFALARASKRLSLTEISTTLGILPSTVHRHLASLSKLGLVQQAEPNGRYELGPGALEFGFAALRNLDAQKLWSEAVARLRDETGLTTLAVVWGTFGPTVVQWKASVSPVTMHVHLGAVLPLAVSASGHIFSAFHDDAEVSEVLQAEFKSRKQIFLSGKPLSRAAFLELVTSVRDRHMSRIAGDMHTGVDSLSAPVFKADGSLQLALTILGGINEIEMSWDGPHANALRSTASWLSERLGYLPPAPKEHIED